MRIFGCVALGLFWSICVVAQEVPTLQPSPKNPYFLDFLLPERALAGFESGQDQALGRLVRTYHSDFVIPFLDSLGSTPVRQSYIEGVLNSWSPELRRKIFPEGFDAEHLAKNYADSSILSAREKAALSSIVSLEIIQDLRLPRTAYDMELLRSFIGSVEKDTALVAVLLQIDPVYAQEKLDDIEAWVENPSNASRLPFPLKNKSKLVDQLSYEELAAVVVEMARQERSTTNAWGSVFGSLDLVKLLIERKDWGTLTEDQKENIGENTWLAVEDKYEQQAKERWQSELWNPLRDDASLTRTPALLATGLGLRYMTRWLNVRTGFPRSFELYYRQMEAASGLPRETLEKWVKDPSKSLTPKHIRRENAEPFRRADFRESFRGARAQHLQEQSLHRMAVKAFGPQANTQAVDQFLNHEVYPQGVDQVSRMNEVCAVELAHIEAGGMRAMAARRLLQRHLADAASFRGYNTSLKTRVRQFIQEEYGIAPGMRNYFPLVFRRHWIPIGRNPIRQFAQGMQNISPRYRNSLLNYVPNPRLPAGGSFRSVWPLEFSPSSITAAMARRLGTTALIGSVASAVTDSLLYLEQATGDPYNVNTKDEETDRLLQEILSDLEGQLQIQTWSVEELYVAMGSLELQFSAQRREHSADGEGRRPQPIKIFVDPRSAETPEKTTGRVPVVYVIAVPVERDGSISWDYLDQALLIRFDSVWSPESQERIQKLNKASWKVSYVLDFSKASEAHKIEFRSSLGFDPSGKLWIDPKKAGGLLFQATPEMFLYDSRSGASQ